MGGDLYYIEHDELNSWKSEVEKLGFAIEDMSASMSEPDRRTFVFVGKLKTAAAERWAEIQAWGSGYVLSVRFAGKEDPDFLSKTLGSRFSRPPELVRK